MGANISLQVLALWLSSLPTSCILHSLVLFPSAPNIQSTFCCAFNCVHYCFHSPKVLQRLLKLCCCAFNSLTLDWLIASNIHLLRIFTSFEVSKSTSLVNTL